MRENGFSRIPLFQSSESCRKVDMRPLMILIFSLLGTVLSLYCFIVNICIFYWPIEITCLCQFLLTAISKNLSDWPSSLKKRDQIRLGTHDRIDGDAFASKTLNQYLHRVQKLTKALKIWVLYLSSSYVRGGDQKPWCEKFLCHWTAGESANGNVELWKSAQLIENYQMLVMIKNISNGIFFCNKLQGSEDLGLQSGGDVSSAFGDNIANNDFDPTGQVGE